MRRRDEIVSRLARHVADPASYPRVPVDGA